MADRLVSDEVPLKATVVEVKYELLDGEEMVVVGLVESTV